MAEELHTGPPGMPANPETAPRPRAVRVLQRVLYSTVRTALAAALLGALIVGVLGGGYGALHQGIVGALFGALYGAILGACVGLVAGATLGAFSGLVAGVLAWVFDGPWKGALRCGAVFAVLMGLIGLGVVIASGPGGAGAGHALAVVLPGVAMGSFGGAALGAFLGWLAGPIFREVVQELDKRRA